MSEFAVPYCPSEMCCNILSNSWLLMTLEPMPESMNAGDFVGFGPHKPPACSSFSFAKLLFSPSTVARHAGSSCSVVRTLARSTSSHASSSQSALAKMITLPTFPRRVEIGLVANASLMDFASEP